MRIYYEDTDFSGRVYHASYLRFLERGRTEWLRSIGFEHRTLAGAQGVSFAIRSLNIEYLSAAFMDDALLVETRAKSGSRAMICFEQRIRRNETVLVDAEVRVVALKNDRAARPPRELLERIAAVTRRSDDEVGPKAL